MYDMFSISSQLLSFKLFIYHMGQLHIRIVGSLYMVSRSKKY